MQERIDNQASADMTEGTRFHGLQLRGIRENLGLTQTDVASRIGMTASGYRHYESDRVRLHLEDIPVLAKAFYITPEYLLTELGVTQKNEVPTIETIRSNILLTQELGEEEKQLLIGLMERLKKPDQYTLNV